MRPVPIALQLDGSAASTEVRMPSAVRQAGGDGAPDLRLAAKASSSAAAGPTQCLARDGAGTALK